MPNRAGPERMPDAAPQGNTSSPSEGPPLLCLAAEETDDGLILFDAGRAVIALNLAAATLVGCTEEEAIGCSCRDLFGCGEEGEGLCGAGPCLLEDLGDAGPSGLRHDLTLRRRDGEEIWLDVTRRALASHLSLLTLRDVTARRRLEQIKAEFVAQVAHELRAPLTVILGYSELLSQPDLLDEPPETYAEAIRSEARHLERLVSDLLDFSRMDTGRFRLESGWMDMRELVDEVVDLYAQQYHGHQFLVEAPDDLPLVYADPNRIRQVLINLISNAVKYSPSGGEVAVALVTADEPPEMLVSVQDEGMGIAPQDRERIFIAFFRAPQRLPHLVEGLGLGLTVSKALVEAHDGRIWVESEPDRGSTFTFSLPLSAGPEGDL